MALGRCARVGTLPVSQPRGSAWPSGPRTPGPGALATLRLSVRIVAAGWQYWPARPSSFCGSPPPAGRAPATGCEGSALTLLFPELSFPFREMGWHPGLWGHLEVRLLLSFHFFLCLSSPAGEGLQRPFRWGMLPLRPTPHRLPSPTPHGEAAEWPALGSWQRFRRFGRIKRGSGAGGQAGLQGEGIGSGLEVTAQAWLGGT